MKPVWRVAAGAVCLMLCGCCELFPSLCIVTHKARGKCLQCDGLDFEVETSNATCTTEQALNALKARCGDRSPLDPSSVTYISEPVIDIGQCNGSKELQPLRETVELFQSAYKTVVRTAPVAETVPGPICPVTFTVIARNQNQDPDAPCDDAREVRVVYEKYVSGTPGPVEVTLSAVVPFGGSHTFTCTDAYPSEDGSASYFYVIYQLYNFVPNEVCEPVPFEDGGMSRGFSQELRNRGTLDITYLPVGSGRTFDYTIDNPPIGPFTAAPADQTVRLQPIPDPKFTRNR
jgi:hypothetical protein